MTKSKAPLVMLEQMVMLLVFALAAALCLQAFVKSDAASRESEARDRAALLCQSMAEVLRGNGGSTSDAIYQVFGEYYADPMPLKDDMTPAEDGEEAAYYLEIVPRDFGDPGYLGADIHVWKWDNQEDLFSLEILWQVEVAE